MSTAQKPKSSSKKTRRDPAEPSTSTAPSPAVNPAPVSNNVEFATSRSPPPAMAERAVPTSEPPTQAYPHPSTYTSTSTTRTASSVTTQQYQPSAPSPLFDTNTNIDTVPIQSSPSSRAQNLQPPPNLIQRAVSSIVNNQGSRPPSGSNPASASSMTTYTLNYDPNAPSLSTPPQAPVNHNPVKFNWDHVVHWIKVRKLFTVLGFTQIKVGMDFNPKTFQYKFKYSWKDKLFGGRIDFYGNEVSIMKRFMLNNNTALHLKGAVDIYSRRSYVGFSIKQEFGRVGMSQPQVLGIRRKIPVDKNVKVQVDASIQLPEATFTLGSHGFRVGHGPVEVDVNEVNILFYSY
eukprot:CAMPEP_0184691812 /NCGR_PEP_ID=MMETSP0313-20130426/540_1 /TAXON_ID=2792 /ORGANISM="Porphyridium aerugineum, Strain SAG 1380-2" /LENGTH=345 /DNA_ID=CAMNT_0027149577 /DNA_START=41 /DNA_END=1078 /DNA_ORIENTATION=-